MWDVAPPTCDLHHLQALAWGDWEVENQGNKPTPISLQQFLESDSASISAQFETRARLERLSTSSSISSADLFDEQRKQTAGEAHQGSRASPAPARASP